jgi:iron complex outermembrane recepter protein
MKKTAITGALALILSPIAFAEENLQLDDVTVKANRFEHKDTEATYATEIHTAKQIEESGSATLYEYLAQHTSLNLASNFGNKATPSINLRGYGGENGYQNVVITVDGQRFNSIDQVPQLLGSIPLGNIERIEIAKGSGSVIYGDGATAGAIQIYTKAKTGVTVNTSFGDHGQQNHYLNAGISEKYFELSASLAKDEGNGFSEKDKTGHKDEFTSDTQNVKLKIKPTDQIEFFAESTNSRNDIRYPNSLTLAQFQQNPAQNGKPSTSYTHQGLYTQTWQVGTEVGITEALKFRATHLREDKTSNYYTSSFKNDYDHDANDVSIDYNDEIWNAIVGYQDFDGIRIGSSDITSKTNRGYYAQAELRPKWLSEALTLSAGARNERVNYHYVPTSGSTLQDSRHLNAWDIGANYQFSDELSGFTNFNHAFEAPDIDRFFGFDSSFNTIFNGFIKPEKSNTINVGINHVLANNRLKITAFHANLHDEIYYNSVFNSGTNTNFDKSHKYGIEIQDNWQISDTLSSNVLYNYTRAIIDQASNLSNANGKELPGNPKHSVVANLNWKFIENANLNFNHTWRSGTYVYNDFDNNDAQKQGHYESTNLALSYQFKHVQLFTTVNNLFEHRNYIQTAPDTLYPTDFERTWRVGVKADF